MEISHQKSFKLVISASLQPRVLLPDRPSAVPAVFSNLLPGACWAGRVERRPTDLDPGLHFLLVQTAVTTSLSAEATMV